MPSTVEVLGHRIAIEWSAIDAIDGNPGRARPSRQQIHVAKEQGDDSRRDTLFHEVVHVVDTLTANPETRLTEAQIMRVATGLLTTLREPRNRRFVEWVIGR
jgi:hypothetical protein